MGPWVPGSLDLEFPTSPPSLQLAEEATVRGRRGLHFNMILVVAFPPCETWVQEPSTRPRKITPAVEMQELHAIPTVSCRAFVGTRYPLGYVHCRPGSATGLHRHPTGRIE